MKKLIILSLSVFLCTALMAQKGKNKNTGGNDPKKEARDIILGGSKNEGPSGGQTGNTTSKRSDEVIWAGTSEKGGGGPKPSKNQPAKVRSAFQNDYPNATNVRWSKYRGDWTATFGNGPITSTAVYHANGQRKDTRTVVSRPQVPKIIIDDILKRKPRVQLSDIVKIEVPQAARDIFRIRTVEGGTSRYMFYDAGGVEVKYNY